MIVVRRMISKYGNVSDKFFDAKNSKQAKEILKKEKEKLKDRFIFGYILNENEIISSKIT